jgi:uncharacterized ferritin-like protein (DUF455 family)
MVNFFEQILIILLENDVAKKCNKVQQLAINNFCFEAYPIKKIEVAGIPDKPKLVRFQNVPKRNSKNKGLIHTIHAIVHIEFNAINLALDALYRFQDMPEKYYQDWLKVAKEETKHFLLVQGYLQELGYQYGDFDAHNGLWLMTTQTDHDVMVRMALVPRVLEARGLDVTPNIKKKFIGSPYEKMIDILDIIFDDEIGHVAIGSYWFKKVCDERNLDSEQIFQKLIVEYVGDKLRAPFNFEARAEAGFSQKELDFLKR